MVMVFFFVASVFSVAREYAGPAGTFPLDFSSLFRFAVPLYRNPIRILS
jgi:hypothetical protein